MELVTYAIDLTEDTYISLQFTEHDNSHLSRGKRSLCSKYTCFTYIHFPDNKMALPTSYRLLDNGSKMPYDTFIGVSLTDFCKSTGYSRDSIHRQINIGEDTYETS